MRTKLTTHLAAFTALLLAPLCALAQEVRSSQKSHSHSHAESSGNSFSSGGGSSSSSQRSVTVTSDGKTTIRRIETTRYTIGTLWIKHTKQFLILHVLVLAINLLC